MQIANTANLLGEAITSSKTDTRSGSKKKEEKIKNLAIYSNSLL